MLRVAACLPSDGSRGLCGSGYGLLIALVGCVIGPISASMSQFLLSTVLIQKRNKTKKMSQSNLLSTATLAASLALAGAAQMITIENAGTQIHRGGTNALWYNRDLARSTIVLLALGIFAATVVYCVNPHPESVAKNNSKMATAAIVGVVLGGFAWYASDYTPKTPLSLSSARTQNDNKQAKWNGRILMSVGVGLGASAVTLMI